MERARPKGEIFNRRWSMDAEDCRRNLFQCHSSLSPNDVPLIEEKHFNRPVSETSERCSSWDLKCSLCLVLEDLEILSTMNEIRKLSLFDSTNTFGKFLWKNLHEKNSSFIIAQHQPSKKPSNIPFSSCQTNEYPQSEPIEFFHSNILIAQSNYSTNPFTSYAMSSDDHSDVFTPKRGTNPFDDDLFRR